MIKKKSFLWIVAAAFLSGACTNGSSQTYPPPAPTFKTDSLMTAQDTLNSLDSNISITNGAGQQITASGLYIASVDINDCSACFGSVVAGGNTTGGFVEPITFGNGQTIKLGQNYLYNLIYSGINYVKQVVGSSPCQLPGCSWSGDTPNVKWCISLGILSRNSTYTSSTYTNGSHPAANVVPYGAAASSVPFNYKFDLMDPSTLGSGGACLGVITCNDQSLTCSVSSPQNQTFQSY